MGTMLDQPRPPKRYYDEFEVLFRKMVDGYVEADEVDYDEAISMVTRLGGFVERVWDDTVHSAALGCLDAQNERALTELNYYKDKEQLEKLGSDQIVRELEQRDDEEEDG
jgi:hypothetical protein